MRITPIAACLSAVIYACARTEPTPRAPVAQPVASAVPSPSTSASDALDAELESLEMKALGSLGGTASSGATMSDSSLDQVAAGSGGVDTGGGGIKTGSAGSGPLMPGQSGAPAPTSSVQAAKSLVTITPSAPAGIDKFITQNRWRFTACYKKALVDAPSLSGSITIKATFDKEGLATAASAVTSSFPAPLTTCLLTGARSVKVEPSNAGTYTFTVTLTPG